MNEAAWLAASPTDRDQIGQLLAFHAACQVKAPPREQSVTIRSEFGRILTQRLVETNVDPLGILKE
jgi:hypothetical protein